jgi:hypothetical protein
MVSDFSGFFRSQHLSRAERRALPSYPTLFCATLASTASRPSIDGIT